MLIAFKMNTSRRPNNTVFKVGADVPNVIGDEKTELTDHITFTNRTEKKYPT